jgi:calcium-dependent protein kinase
MVIANQCQESDIISLREKFNEIDINHDGAITFNELQQSLLSININPAEIQQIWNAMDVDGNGSISYSEFLAATLDKNVYLQEERLWNAFKVFDVDGSGKITADELKQVLSSEDFNSDVHIWTQILSQVDENSDGEIDFNEFCAMMESIRGASSGPK